MLYFFFQTWTPFPSFGDGFPAPPGTAPAPGTPGTPGAPGPAPAPGAPGPAPAPGAPGPAPGDTGTDTDAGTGGTPGRGIEPQTANVPDGAQNIIVESVSATAHKAICSILGKENLSKQDIHTDIVLFYLSDT